MCAFMYMKCDTNEVGEETRVSSVRGGVTDTQG